MIKIWSKAALFMSIGLLFLHACAPQPEIKETQVEYVWPLPPDEPKVKFIKSIWGDRDLKKAKSAMDVFAGEESSNDLLKPYGVATDRAGRIFVTDTIRRLVFIFDEAASKTSLIGAKEKTFRMPVDIAVDDSSRIYVSDTGTDTVMVLSPDDKLLTQFGRGILENPSGLAIDNAGQKVYVVSTKTHRVEVFSFDGTHLFGFGGRGNAPGKMNFPTDVTVSPDGRLYVVDSLNFRIQIFNKEGVFLKTFGGVGTSPGQFSRPKGIAADRDGNIFVTDAAFNNFQIFNPDGQLLLFIGSGGVVGPGEFSLPAGIHIDSNNRIYVADQLNRRIQIFQKLK